MKFDIEWDLRQSANGGFVLCKDDGPCLCPFNSEVSFCTTKCVHFDLDIDKEVTVDEDGERRVRRTKMAILTCSGKPVTRKLVSDVRG